MCQSDRIELKPIRSNSNLSDTNRRLETDRFELEPIDSNANLSDRCAVLIFNGVGYVCVHRINVDKLTVFNKVELLNLIKGACARAPTDNKAAHKCLTEVGLITCTFDPDAHGLDCEGFEDALITSSIEMFAKDEDCAGERAAGATPGGTRTVSGFIARAVSAKSLHDQLQWVRSPAYEKQTVHCMVLKYLEWLENNEHEGFLDEGWSAKEVYAKWQSLHLHRAALRERFGGGGANSYPILPVHASMFLNDVHKKKMSDTSGGGRRTLQEDMLSHGAVLNARTGMNPFKRIASNSNLSDPTQIYRIQPKPIGSNPNL